jgi:hypothetical protein
MNAEEVGSFGDWPTACGSAAAARKPGCHVRRPAGEATRPGRPTATFPRTPPTAAVSCSRLLGGSLAASNPKSEDDEWCEPKCLPQREE